MPKTTTKRGRPEKGLYMQRQNTAILDRSFTYEGKYAVYGLAASDAPENILYVGFTSTKLFKRYNSHLNSGKMNRNPKEKWINQLLREGKKPVLIVLEDGISYFEQAGEKERNYISQFTDQGVELLNRKIGGPGIVGQRHTEETPRKQSEAQKPLAEASISIEKTSGIVTEMKMRIAS